MLKSRMIYIGCLLSITSMLLSCGSDDEPTVDGNSIVIGTISPDNYGGDDGISVDGNGNIYVSNLGPTGTGGFRGRSIYKVTPSGESTLFSDDLNAPLGHAFDGNGNLFVSNINTSKITKISPDGSSIDFLEDGRLRGGSLVFDSEGNMYHTVYSTNTLYKITSDGTITEMARGGLLNVPLGIVIVESGDLYIANFGNGRINKVTPTGEVSEFVTIPSQVGYITYLNNKIYATGYSSHNVYEISLDGSFEVIAGISAGGNIDGPVSKGAFFGPNGIAASPDGKTLYITQLNKTIRTIKFPD